MHEPELVKVELDLATVAAVVAAAVAATHYRSLPSSPFCSCYIVHMARAGIEGGGGKWQDSSRRPDCCVPGVKNKVIHPLLFTNSQI